MSVVAGIVDRSGVILCADSVAYAEDGATEIRRDPKVFERGAMVIGVVSNPRVAQLLRYSLGMPRRKPGQDVFEFMGTAFIEAVRKCLKDGGCVGVDEENDSIEKGGTFLCGYEGRLFSVDHGLAIGETSVGFDAIGGGAPLALGALHAQEIFLIEARRSKRELTYGAKQRLIDALRVAERATNVVRKPYVTVRCSRRTRRPN